MHRPLLVDLTVEEQTRLKVIYGSAEGFHAVDLDSAIVYDIYLPKHVSSFICLYLNVRLIFPCLFSFVSPTLLVDSGSNLAALHRHAAQLERHAAAAVLRQRRRLRQHDGSGVEEHRPAVGRDADLGRVHRYRPDHGLGQQGNRGLYFFC